MKERQWWTELLQSGYFEMSLAFLILGSLGLVVKMIDLSALMITFGRLLFACLALSVFVRLNSGSLVYPEAKQAIGLLLLIGVLTAGSTLTFVAAFKYIPVANAVLIGASYSVITTALAPKFLGERVQAIAIVALLLATGGVILIALPGARAMSTDDLFGVILAFSSAWLGAIDTIAIKKVDRSVPSQVLNVYRYAVAAIILFPLVLYGESSHITGVAVLLIFVSGVVHTALAGTIYLFGLRKAEAHKAAILATLEPMSATLLAWIFLSERLDLFTASGGALILLSSSFVVHSRGSTPR